MAEARDDAPRRALGLGIAAVAFAVYGICTAPAPYLLDSAELAEAAFALGIAHPPGEVLNALWGKLWMFLPLGSIAFRAGLAQAAAGAMATAVLFALLVQIGDRLAEEHAAGAASTSRGRTVRLAIAVAAALVFGFAPGSVLSADRPEVYALQVLLSLTALALALCAARTEDARPALGAALIIGLGLGQNALLAGTTGLGAAAAAWPLVVRLRARLVVVSIGALVAGALVVVYLPLRAAAGPTLEWGDASTPAGFWWVVSARTFAGTLEVVHANASSGDAPFLLMEEVGPVAALLAAGGLYVLARRPAGRGTAVSLALSLLGSVGAAIFSGLDPQNPDIRGYLGVAIAVTAAFAALPLLLAASIAHSARVRAALAVLAMAAAIHALPRGIGEASRRRAVAAAAFGREILADVPAGGSLLTSNFQTFFLASYLMTVEGARPDVAHLHLGFVRGPGYAERATRANPELRPFVESFLGGGGSIDRLIELGAERPLRIEPDPHLDRAIRNRMRPAGLLWRLEGVPERRPSSIAPEILDVELALEGESPGDRQVRGLLAWRLYSDAALACEIGLREYGEMRLARLDRLTPEDPMARALGARCGIAVRR